MKRELVMLAHKYTNQDISDYVWSEKLDGLRAIWIPQWRGYRPRWQRGDIDATGLFSRYGRVFRAPDWWLDTLPDVMLDGELIAGTLSDTQSVCRSHSGDWRNVIYNVFDSPAPQVFTGPGQVRNPHHEHLFTNEDRFDVAACVDFQLISFEGEHHTTIKHFEIDDLTEHLDDVLSLGGEGLILRKKGSIWLPFRRNTLLKVTSLSYGEGTVTGYVDSVKLPGMIKSIQVDNSFQVTGFNFNERYTAKTAFPIGSSIKYKYSRRTSHGLPQFARFVR